MKHLIPFLILGIAGLFACSENSTFDEVTHDITFRANNTSICHLNDEGVYQNININSKALPAHLAHGDYLSDEEGYCVTCTHCDINTITQYEWVAYLDTDDLICTIYTGATIWTDLNAPGGNARAVSAIEFPSTGQKYVLSWLPSGSYCQREVGVDITEEEWEDCLTFIRKLIPTRPDTPELCDILNSSANNSPEIKGLTTSVYKLKAIPFSTIY